MDAMKQPGTPWIGNENVQIESEDQILWASRFFQAKSAYVLNLTDIFGDGIMSTKSIIW